MFPPSSLACSRMKRFLLASLAAIALPAIAAESPNGWYPLFDGKSLDGWKATENPATFKVEDGQIVVNGKRAHLFYVGPVNNHDFKNFEFKAEVKTKPKANSGIYFHTEMEEKNWPSKGYEVQINTSHPDPKKTGGLYAIKDVMESPVKDDEWFTVHIAVQGKRIVTKVNDKILVDYTEEEKPERSGSFAGRILSHGTFALQGHDPESTVYFRNIEVKPLP